MPTFEANQPDFDLEKFRPADKTGRKDPTAKRLTRLHINDIGALGEGTDRRIVRVRKMTAAKNRTLVFLDDHNEADVARRIGNKEMKERKYSARQLRRSGFRKCRRGRNWARAGPGTCKRVIGRVIEVASAGRHWPAIAA